MDELNLKTLEQIPIPKGLEERLSKKIDEWDAQPTTPSIPPRGEASNTPPRGRWRGVAVAAAACFALVFGVGYHLMNQEENTNLAEQDTYQDPVKAQQEAERALNMLAMNLNKGMGHLEKAKALSDKTEQSFYEKLKVMK
ncbi:MAG: hypothetical protein IKH26_04745 [Bacteroidaceae bacterium]|nr:hypothetical protein [Bacteroidaceae bacterium]